MPTGPVLSALSSVLICVLCVHVHPNASVGLRVTEDRKGQGQGQGEERCLNIRSLLE
jgi:hypothetical protein